MKNRPTAKLVVGRFNNMSVGLFVVNLRIG